MKCRCIINALIILAFTLSLVNLNKILDKVSNKDKEMVKEKGKDSENLKTKLQTKNKSKQEYFIQGDPCPCASTFPPCCTQEFESVIKLLISLYPIIIYNIQICLLIK